MNETGIAFVNYAVGFLSLYVFSDFWNVIDSLSTGDLTLERLIHRVEILESILKFFRGTVRIKSSPNVCILIWVM